MLTLHSRTIMLSLTYLYKYVMDFPYFKENVNIKNGNYSKKTDIKKPTMKFGIM